MKYFLIGFFSTFFVALASESFAAETRPLMYRVGETARLQALLDRSNPTIPVTFETTATTPQGQQVTRYTTRNVPTNTARLGSIARSAVGGPAILAATAAFLAYDYFYNEDTGEWEAQPIILDDDVAPVGTAYCTTAGSGQWRSCSSTRYGNLQLERELRGWPDNPSCVMVNSSTGGPSGYGTIMIRNTLNGECSGGSMAQPIYRPAAPIGFIPDGPYQQTSEPITDTQLGDAILNYPDEPWKRAADILNDPIDTGTWRDRWPELLPYVNDIEQQLGHDIEGGPAPANPDQTITDGSTAIPSPSASAGSEPFELPSFCSWVPDWLCDLMVLPENPDTPFVDVVPDDDFVSGIGAGVCPADMNLALSSGTVPLSWEYPCQLATTFRPVVLFFAWLTALYIVVRVK